MPLRRALLLVLAVCGIALASTAQTAAAEGNGLALTPPMGWNDWYSSYCGVSAQLVEQTAQEMVNNGMKAAGYDYVNIDDCWMAPSRDAAGNLVPDPTRFPNGIAPVAAYVHSLGLKLGIYEDAGTATCAQRPGSFGHEAQDAAAFASWGVDYVKYDRCNIPYSDFPGQSQQQVQQILYTRMSNAVKATGRPMVFSMCNPDPGDDPWLWGASISNLWRTTVDIGDNFGSMLVNFEGTVGLYRDARPGAWNDPDMLQIGNGGSSLTEYTSEFSLWAEMAAPLIASTNVATLNSAELTIYENPDVIAVDQDPLGKPGVPISSAGGLWVLTKKLHDGSRAVLLFNSKNTAARIATTATAVGLPARRVYQLDNLWTDAVSETGGGIAAFVPGHGVAMFKVTVDSKRAATELPPQTVLSLTAAENQIDAGRSTTLFETFTDNGTSDVKRVALSLSAPLGWRIKPLGRTRRLPLLKAGTHFTVAYRIAAPKLGPALATSTLSGAASFDPVTGRRSASATLGELVSVPVGKPFATADETAYPAAFGAADYGLAISARGGGEYSPPNGAAPTDSYAAIYVPGGAGPTSTAQVTVTADQANGPQGGAGLIERNRMTAHGSPAAVALYVSGNATIAMAWNASGGADVDHGIVVPSVIIGGPVELRLVRQGSTYTGYYSTDGGVTWNPVDTVTVAALASNATQDLGVFHASGLPTWTTTATFTNLQVG